MALHVSPDVNHLALSQNFLLLLFLYKFHKLDHVNHLGAHLLAQYHYSLQKMIEISKLKTSLTFAMALLAFVIPAFALENPVFVAEVIECKPELSY